jgi:hypothetical protein
VELGESIEDLIGSPEIRSGIEDTVREASSMPNQKKESDSLKGWQEIARFLGQPLSVAQRWSKSGMPVTHDGRRVQASPEELNRWLGREAAGEPLQIASENTDLSSELKRGLAHVRKHSPPARKKKRAA